MKIPPSVSLVMLLVMTLFGVGYMGISVLDINPRRNYNTVTVLLPSSGGLMDTSQVDLRGMKVGRVKDISTSPSGLSVQIELDDKYPIPVDSEVRIANLSAAGEQYLDIRPAGTEGPYLHDGSVVPASQVKVSATVSETLSKADALSAQIDPAAVENLAATFAAGYEGRDPEVKNLTRAVTLLGQMLHDKQDAIRRLYINIQTLGDNFDGYGPVIAGWTPTLETAGPELIDLIRAFQDYSYAGENVWDQPIGPLVQKIDKYVSLLAPDLAMLATIIKPSTSQIRPLRIDAGSIMNVLFTVFPEGGPARVSVDVPK